MKPSKNQRKLRKKLEINENHRKIDENRWNPVRNLWNHQEIEKNKEKSSLTWKIGPSQLDCFQKCEIRTDPR